MPVRDVYTASRILDQLKHIDTRLARIPDPGICDADAKMHTPRTFFKIIISRGARAVERLALTLESLASRNLRFWRPGVRDYTSRDFG